MSSSATSGRHHGAGERRHGGAEALGGSFTSAISAGGRFVTFQSPATNLVPNDNNGQFDIFVRDRQAGTTERVSVAPAGPRPSAAASSLDLGQRLLGGVHLLRFEPRVERHQRRGRRLRPRQPLGPAPAAAGLPLSDGQVVRQGKRNAQPTHGQTGSRSSSASASEASPCCWSSRTPAKLWGSPIVVTCWPRGAWSPPAHRRSCAAPRSDRSLFRVACSGLRPKHLAPGM